MRRLLVLGFYGKGNLGDEMFKETIPLLFPDFICIFISTDDFKGDLSEYDAIVCGGGDIYNEYFMKKIEQILTRSPNGFQKPVYLLGVGIPYPSMLKTHYLSLFDHVFLRELTDLPEVTRQIGGRYAHSLPDLGFLKKPRVRKESNKTIGVFLAQPVFRDKSIESLLSLLEHVSKFGRLKFIRFNTSGNPSEDDQYIQDRVESELKTKHIVVDNDRNIYTTDQLLDLIAQMDFAICSRFHAHIFCTIAACPFISISTTRKTQLFLQEEQLDLAITENRDLIDQFNRAWEKRVEFSAQLAFVANRNYLRINTRQINNLLIRRNRRPKEDTFDQLDPRVIYDSSRKLLFTLTGYDVESKSTDLTRINDYDAAKVAAHLCFEITKIPGSKYEWGTQQNIKTRPWELAAMIDWIIKDHRKTKIREFPKLDLDYYDQNGLSGLHRAGWQYVLTYLRILNNPHGVLCDTFADRSFLWGRWSLTEAGILPYTSMWIGFVHHTPNQEYTDNNCWEMIKSNEFVQSLPTCRGIVCLSEYLSNWFRTRFQEMCVNVPVVTLKHPTLFVDKKWDPTILQSDPVRLVNVGAWYRNPYTIYKITTPPYIQKMSLKGPKMEDYFPPDKLELTPSQIQTLNPYGNKWLYYFFLDQREALAKNSSLEFNSAVYQQQIESVKIVEQLGNNEYDQLLSSCVVFLHLIDVSAANTVIECIVRETPILVNRHPALEEYLGREYPLFYENLSEIPTLLEKTRILQAHQYLKKYDKQTLKIEHFLSELINTDIYQKLFSE
jgi:hypothetical protein